MALRKSPPAVAEKPPETAKPDPANYNDVVSRASVRDIRLVGSKLDFKPEAVETAEDDWEFELTHQLDDWSCDNERGLLSGIHSFNASLVARRKKLLVVHCRYLTTYTLSNPCDGEAGRHFLLRVARLAAYPYFRATFATLTQQSGISLPPLPVLSDGPRWVTAPAPAEPALNQSDKPSLPAPASVRKRTRKTST
jgi:hypothetical protein